MTKIGKIGFGSSPTVEEVTEGIDGSGPTAIVTDMTNRSPPGSLKLHRFDGSRGLAAFSVKFTALLFLLKSIPQGATTTAFLALNPQVHGVTGKYFVDANEEETPSAYAKDPEFAKKLWDFSV